MQILNTKQLDELLQIEKATDEKILEELMTIFQHQLIDFFKRSKECIKQLEWLELSKLAHSLKSSAGNLGMLVPFDLCLRIETEAKKQTAIDYIQLINQLENETQIAIDAVKKYMSKDGPE